MRGGGSKGVWNSFKNSSDLVAESFPYTNICGNRNVLDSSLRSVKEFTESFSPNREEFTFYPLGSLPGYYHFALNRSCWVDDLYPLKRTWNFIQKSFIFQREALRGEIRPSCHSRQECRMFVSGGNFSMNTNFVVTVSLKLFKFTV